MAEYPIRYVVDGAAALALIDQIDAAVVALGNHADQTAAKLRDMTKGAVSPLNAAAKAVAGLGSAMGTLDTQSAAASGGIGKVSAVATGAAAPLSAAANAGRSLGSALQQVATRSTAAGAGLQQVGTSAGQVHAPFGSVQTAAAGVAAGFESMIAKGLLISGVVGLAHSLGEEFKRIRDEMKAMSEEAIKTRAAMREVGVLSGKGSEEATAETVEFGRKAGLKPEQAARFMEQYLGSAPAGRQKGNISAATEKALADEAAVFGLRNKLNPETAGDLAGSISQYGKIPNAEAGAQTLGRVLYGLTEGRGNSEPLARSLINTAGAVVEEGSGPIKDLEGLSVALGVASTHHNPAAAGTYLKKAIREIRQNAKLPGMKALGITGQEEYLSSMGDKDDALHKLAPVILAADRSGKGGDNALREMGFKDEAAIQAIVEGARDLDVIDKRMEARKKITGKSVMAKDRDFLTKDLAGLNYRAEAEDAASRYVEGHKQERALIAKKNALTRMRDSGELTDTDNVVADKAIDALSLTGQLSLPTHLETRVAVEAREELRREFVNAGGNPNDPRLNQTDAAGNVRPLSDIFNSGVVEETIEKGGQPLGKTGAVGVQAPAPARDPAKKAETEAARKPHAAPAAPPRRAPGPLAMVRPPAEPGGLPAVFPEDDRPAAGLTAANGPIPVMGIRGFLAASAMGALPGSAAGGWGPKNTRPPGLVAEAFAGEAKPHTPGPAAVMPPDALSAFDTVNAQNEDRGLPGFQGTEKQAAKILAHREKTGAAKASKAWDRKWVRRPDAASEAARVEREETGNVSLPTDPAERARIATLGVRKPDAAEADPAVAAVRRPAAGDPAAGGVFGAGPGSVAAPGGAGDEKSAPLLRDIAKILERIERKSGSGGYAAAVAPVGPLPVAGGDFTGRRS